VLLSSASRKSTQSYFKLQFLSAAGYYCCWKLIFENRGLKRCDSFPKWQFRIVRKGYSEFEDFGHGQREVVLKGSLDYLREPYLHYPFSKGWSDWLERHNRYSSQEAELRLHRSVSMKELFSPHSAVRLKSLRSLVSRIPGWPLLRFIIPYFLKLGFLEGRAAFIYCVNISFYEYLIKLKMRELRQSE